MEIKMIMTWSDLRAACISNNWCDRCNNEQYTKLLNLCEASEIGIDRLQVICESIVCYTSKYNIWNAEDVENVAYTLLNDGWIHHCVEVSRN